MGGKNKSKQKKKGQSYAHNPHFCMIMPSEESGDDHIAPSSQS